MPGDFDPTPAFYMMAAVGAILGFAVAVLLWVVVQVL